MVLSKPSNITNIQSVKKKLNKTSLRGSIEHDERDLQEMHESFFKDMSKAKLSSVDPAYHELQEVHRKHQKNMIKTKQMQTLLPHIVTPKLIREKEPLNYKVNEEQRLLDQSRKQIIDLIRSRKALGGEVSLPKLPHTTGNSTPISSKNKYQTLNQVIS